MEVGDIGHSILLYNILARHWTFSGRSFSFARFGGERATSTKKKEELTTPSMTKVVMVAQPKSIEIVKMVTRDNPPRSVGGGYFQLLLIVAYGTDAPTLETALEAGPVTTSCQQ